MKFCKICGAGNADENKFCDSCGSEFDNVVSGNASDGTDNDSPFKVNSVNIDQSYTDNISFAQQESAGQTDNSQGGSAQGFDQNGYAQNSNQGYNQNVYNQGYNQGGYNQGNYGQNYPQAGYGQNGYYQNGYNVPPKTNDYSSMCIMSLVFGILSIFCNPLYLFTFLTFFFGVFGIVKNSPKKGLAIAGLICGGIGIICQAIFDVLTLGVGVLF